MGIIFMGTPDFSVPVLQGLIDAGEEILAVYSQPPRRAGRGKITQKSPVHCLADDYEIPVLTPLNFKTAKDREDFQALNAEIAIVVAYGLILPQEILDAPTLGCINIHASLLPRWRGAAPIQRAIMAGDEETGVAIMQMEAGLDTGPVFAETIIPISPEMTAGSLHDRLSVLGAELLLETFPKIKEGSIKAKRQRGREVTYAQKIDKREARIDWTMPADHIERMVRGLSPFPGAWFEVQKHRIKILEAEADITAPRRGEPGQMLEDNYVLACGKGEIKLKRLQRAGKEALNVTDFMRGFKIETGLILE